MMKFKKNKPKKMFSLILDLKTLLNGFIVRLIISKLIKKLNKTQKVLEQKLIEPMQVIKFQCNKNYQRYSGLWKTKKKNII